MDTAAVLLRLVVALASVLGLIWLFSRGLQRGRGGRLVPGVTELLARQPISRAASVVVVRVGERALVLGVTEQQVSLLAETDLPVADPAARRTEVVDLSEAGSEAKDVDVSALVPAPRTASDRSGHQGSALAGSALSPTTWIQALDVLRERTTRR